MEGKFDAAVRDHLTSDLGKPGEAVGDADETFLVDYRDVTGDVPAVADRRRRKDLSEYDTLCWVEERLGA